MRADLPAGLPLICLACRTVDERGRNLFSLAVELALETSAGGAEIEQGTLRCANPACGRRYPIIDGIPIIVPDPSAFVAREIVEVLEHDLHPKLAAMLAEPGPDDAPYTRLIEHLSIYLDAHWGDRATPAPEGPGGCIGLAALGERLAARRIARVPCAVELGCSVGRGLAELALGADLAVGVDLRFASLRRARAILSGRPVAYPRRMIGRHYAPATITSGSVPNAAVVCADASDPPFAPGGFDRVVALNLIDTVHNPLAVIAVVDGLCAPGGEVILSSPYAWQTGHVAEHHRFGEADPAAELIRRLTGGVELEARYTIEDAAELPWILRRDARSAVSYLAHYVRARRDN